MARRTDLRMILRAHTRQTWLGLCAGFVALYCCWNGRRSGTMSRRSASRRGTLRRVLPPRCCCIWVGAAHCRGPGTSSRRHHRAAGGVPMVGGNCGSGSHRCKLYGRGVSSAPALVVIRSRTAALPRPLCSDGVHLCRRDGRGARLPGRSDGRRAPRLERFPSGDLAPLGGDVLGFMAVTPFILLASSRPIASHIATGCVSACSDLCRGHRRVSADRMACARN